MNFLSKTSKIIIFYVLELAIWKSIQTIILKKKVFSKKKENYLPNNTK